MLLKKKKKLTIEKAVQCNNFCWKNVSTATESANQNCQVINCTVEVGKKIYTKGYTHYNKPKEGLHIFHLFSGKGSSILGFPKVNICEGMSSSQYVSANTP